MRGSRPREPGVRPRGRHRRHDLGDQLSDIALVSSQAPPVHVVAQAGEEAAKQPGGAIARHVAGHDENRFAGASREPAEGSAVQGQAKQCAGDAEDLPGQRRGGRLDHADLTGRPADARQPRQGLPRPGHRARRARPLGTSGPTGSHPWEPGGVPAQVLHRRGARRGCGSRRTPPAVSARGDQ